MQVKPLRMTGNARIAALLYAVGQGYDTARVLADMMHVSRERVYQLIANAKEYGLITSYRKQYAMGRPADIYELTADGELWLGQNIVLATNMYVSMREVAKNRKDASL